MIDTIRLKIPLTPLILLAIQNKYTQEIVSKKGNGSKYFSPLMVAPLNEQMTVIKDFDYLGRMNMYFYVEGSLPRVAHGENVRLLYADALPVILKRIEDALVEQYSAVESWKSWEIHRLDLVYAWTYDTGSEALQAMDFLKSLNHSQKNKHIYKTTVTFGGRAFSSTFYLKEFEFIKNGYDSLINNNQVELANYILQISKNVLRFENRLHKAKLVTLFGQKEIYCRDLIQLPNEWYYDVLNDCLKEVLKNLTGKEMNDFESYSNLLKMFPKAKASRLFLFWKVYYLQEHHIKPMFKKMFHSTSLLRNFNDLSKANVGISQYTDSSSLNLTIPNSTAPIAPAIGDIV